MNGPALRTITPAEIKLWFGNSSKASLSETQYSEIAARLTKCRWPSDPPSDARFQGTIVEDNSNDFWDSQAATKSAKMLRDSIPAMLSHWERLRWASETRAGYEVIKVFGDALSNAMPYIEWPFGRYERRTSRKKLKDWHMPAVIFANLIIDAFIPVNYVGRACFGLCREAHPTLRLGIWM
jgi:hypothetical protein